jgi:hypothetical protein
MWSRAPGSAPELIKQSKIKVKSTKNQRKIKKQNKTPCDLHPALPSSATLWFASFLTAPSGTQLTL